MKHGKKYVDAAKLVDRTKLYDTNEALDTVIKTAVAKFDETVELHVKLGVDSRHADQQVRGAVVLPNGTGKKVRVLAICKGANEELAKEAGADFVGAEDMTQKIQQENWMDLVRPLIWNFSPASSSFFCTGAMKAAMYLSRDALVSFSFSLIW